MNDKLNQRVLSLKKDIGLFLYISFSIFLFILFFQPFPLIRFDLNNTLIFVFGIASIVFFFHGAGKILLWFFIQKLKENKKEYTCYSF